MHKQILFVVVCMISALSNASNPLSPTTVTTGTPINQRYAQVGLHPVIAARNLDPAPLAGQRQGTPASARLVANPQAVRVNDQRRSPFGTPLSVYMDRVNAENQRNQPENNGANADPVVRNLAAEFDQA